jgi:hypothetical protein
MRNPQKERCMAHHASLHTHVRTGSPRVRTRLESVHAKADSIIAASRDFPERWLVRPANRPLYVSASHSNPIDDSRLGGVVCPLANRRATHSKPRRVAQDDRRIVVVRHQGGDVRAHVLRSCMRLMREARTDLTRARWKRDIARCRPSGSPMGSTSLRMRSRVLDHDQWIVEPRHSGSAVRSSHGARCAPVTERGALGSFATDHALMVLAQRVRLGAAIRMERAIRRRRLEETQLRRVTKQTQGVIALCSGHVVQGFSRFAGAATEGALT